MVLRVRKGAPEVEALLAVFVLGAVAVAARSRVPAAVGAPRAEGNGPAAPASAPMGSTSPPRGPASTPSPGLDGLGGGEDFSAGALLGAAGAAAGAVGSYISETKFAKDIAAPLGVAGATAAYFASTGGVAVAAGLSTLAAAALWAPVVFVVVVDVVAVIDQIAQAVERDKWRAMTTQVAQLRGRGLFREAWELYQHEAGKYPEAVRSWPQPRDKGWYNSADPLGRPYAGFPGSPAPVGPADVRGRTGWAADQLRGPGGWTVDVERLLAAAASDVLALREWALAHEVPGLAVEGGKRVWVTRNGALKQVLVGAQLVQRTAGPRDVRGWKPYDDARAIFDAVTAGIVGVCPWLRADVFSERCGRSAEEVRVDDARRENAALASVGREAGAMAARSGGTASGALALMADAAGERDGRTSVASAAHGVVIHTPAAAASHTTRGGGEGDGGRNTGGGRPRRTGGGTT